jgi:group I intron endonuclease
MPYTGGIMGALVYQLFNRHTGKSYIGVTTKSALDRFKRHCDRARSGYSGRLLDAIRKWGPDAFDVSVVEFCESTKDALSREREIIAERKPQYNVTAGGEGVFGLVMSDSTRAKMSAAKLGRPAAWLNGSEAAKIISRIADAQRGKPRPAKTVAVFEGRQARASILWRRRARPVRCLDTGEIFVSAMEVKRQFGLGNGQLTHHLVNGSKMRRCKMRFVYETD